MDFLRNVVGLIFFIGIFLPFIGYYPITFLIAWRQAENAENWETTKCTATCMTDKIRGTIGYTHKFWINYGYKARLEMPKMPSGFDFSGTGPLKLDPKLSREERSKKTSEYFEKRREFLVESEKKRRETQEKYDREMQIFEKEQKKYMEEGTEYFSVFQIEGFRYWRNHGWKEICYDGFGNRRPPRFEADCYIDPNNPEKAVFYRKLGLNWFWTILLVLNTALMFGFLWLAFYLFRHGLKKRETSSSLLGG
jgi:hypothetical protein